MTKRALLVGCNYPGTQAALNGCVNDVSRMREMLITTFGFPESNIVVLIDTDSSYTQPTGGNVKRALSTLVAECKPGDVAVFHFSGHGTQVPSPTARESDGKDEAICPSDLNVIVDDDLRRILVNLPEGVKFTMVADCCHSGTLLDHTAVQIEGNKDPDAPEIPSMGALGSLFGFKSLDDRGLEIHNKSLPMESLMQMLGNQSGGQVNANNIHSTLSQLFGADASPQLVQLALPMLLQQLSGAGGANGSSSAEGTGQGGCACLPMLMGLLGGGSKPPSAGASSGAPAPLPGGVAVHLPGQKPPANQQLPDDKGILVTGCQSHETSADACPGGNKSQAYGALSNAIQGVVRQHQEVSAGQPLTNRELVTRVRTVLLQSGFSQNPCLECAISHAEEPFIC
mmetsp:Transcript_24437/g.43497  ORF Transcript_24437/g.43497 Transcript_24437/m.43497 type:complete len:398 (-) Transcript_24437:140-1333(-)|eukprot:CAMPEP_0177771242 /NCGR_PEP_ID=MMETSP0491_2-20121128/11452_1 /TAXON_ID=63592 /ORGANISM="Tetraselmis chuii, Strain PLY429" /LENGTH=397 /DNA_ID=CAMNT_0019288707 /DNA_START=113 /DNA_END=1306 /DNA_ORIENTATION=-